MENKFTSSEYRCIEIICLELCRVVCHITSIKLFGNHNVGAAVGTSAAAVKAQARQEIEAERKMQENAHKLAETYSPARELELEGSPLLAVEGVYFRCPMAGPDVLKKEAMENYIKEFLYSQLADEPELTTALMIHTLNKEPDKVKVCIDTLCKYLDNIILNPAEPKYQKIRVNNKAFQDRVYNLEGTHEFLQAAGFLLKQSPGPNDGVPEDFLVLADHHAQDVDRLKSLKDALLIAEPIKPELDRNVRVFYASGCPDRMEVPPEFFAISPEELKREQQARKEAVERMGMLRTKEMREREYQRELRKYRYCLIRVRFPDSVILQGTFRAVDRLNAVCDFVRENIEMDWIPFDISAVAGSKFEDTSFDKTLAELQLTPASLLQFSFDATVLKEIAAQQGSAKIKHYLKPSLLQVAKAL